MKFTIKKLSVDSIEVEFDDGSKANVPTQKNQTREELLQVVSTYNYVPTPWDNVNDIPVKVGDEHEFKTMSPDDEVDYTYARMEHYPAFGHQLDALYWEREGDDTARKKIDARIKNIKDTITKDKTYKLSEIESLLD